MSDTPRTDEEMFVAVSRPDIDLEAVRVDFARELERENAALRAERDALREVRAAVLAFENISDTDPALVAERHGDEEVYAPEYLRLLRALRATAPTVAPKEAKP